MSKVSHCVHQIMLHQFLFEELVKRDFKTKYKRSVLGMGWSLLNPLLMLAVLWVVFSQFFGRTINHFTTYLFCGNIVFSYFSEASREGMMALRSNAGIFTKVNVPKYVFLLTKNVQVLINFLIALIVLFIFVAMDHVSFTWKFALLMYPILTLTIFNLGVGAILSCFYIFYDDVRYLWSIVIMLIMYGSAIFYPVSSLSSTLQQVFALNPIYRHIEYFRLIIIDSAIPTLEHHFILIGYAFLALIIGALMYKRYNTEFLYYV